MRRPFERRSNAGGLVLDNRDTAVGRPRPATVAAAGAHSAGTLGAEVVLVAHNAELGRRGEQLAVDHLVARGMQVVDRNWRCRLGEIDIVARDGGDTVFVEVKTRTSHDYGHPFEAITPIKLARLRRLAIAWCEATDAPVSRIRIDAVAVLAPAEAPALIEHLEGIS